MAILKPMTTVAFFKENGNLIMSTGKQSSDVCRSLHCFPYVRNASYATASVCLAQQRAALATDPANPELQAAAARPAQRSKLYLR